MTSTTKPYPLTSLRVIDFSQSIAGAYASKLLSDAGADVTLVEPTLAAIEANPALNASPLRQWKKSAALGLSPPLADGDDGALFHYLQGNKKSIAVDCSSNSSNDDKTKLAKLCAQHDLIICDLRANTLSDYGIDIAALQTENPLLSLMEISPYGSNEQGMGTEFTLQADMGSIDYRGYSDRLPVAAGGLLGEYISGSFAAVAALSACTRLQESQRGQSISEQTIPGQTIDVSMFESLLLSFQPFQFIHQQFQPGVPFPREVEIPSIEPTKDGWVGLCTITAQQWKSFCEMIEAPELGELSTQRLRFAAIDRLSPAIHRWTKQHTTAEVLEAAQALHIPAVPVGDGASVFDMDHLKARQVFQPNPAGFKQPRVPYHSTAFATRKPGVAPALGQHNDCLSNSNLSNDKTETPSASAALNRIDFKQLRIVDLTAFWAGPIVGSYFAALGAEVIKVESIQRPDGMRFAAGFFPEDIPVWEASPITHGANSGKLGVTLDLGSEKGRELVAELIKHADIVIENFSPNVIEKYGFGWEQVHALNPKAIMVRMPAFGLDGPWRDRPGFAMTIEQVSGMATMTGYPDRAPLVPRGCVDPLGGMHSVFSILCALQVREQTGAGQLIEVPLIETGLGVAAESMIEHSAYDVLLGRVANQGIYDLQAVFACQEGQLIAVAIENNEQWLRLLALVNSDNLNAINSFTEAKKNHEDEALEHLQAYFSDQAAGDIVALLQQHRIPSAVANNPRDLHTHPVLARREFFNRIEHPVMGNVDYPSFPFRLNGEHVGNTVPAPCLGQHNEQVLGDLLGLAQKEIAQLREQKVIGDRPVFM